MRTVDAYVENHIAMAYDDGSAAWSFDPDLWGVCGQGRDEVEALEDLRSVMPPRVGVVVAERIEGDEQVFRRDRRPCTAQERANTLTVLAKARRGTVDLLRSCTASELEWNDPSRVLPTFATWRTLVDMAWHIADTESRYYLPATGLPDRPRTDDLFTELAESAYHVAAQLQTAPSDLVHMDVDGTWTTVKLLRRLAWHERSELATMTVILCRARSR